MFNLKILLGFGIFLLGFTVVWEFIIIDEFEKLDSIFFFPIFVQKKTLVAKIAPVATDPIKKAALFRGGLSFFRALKLLRWRRCRFKFRCFVIGVHCGWSR